MHVPIPIKVKDKIVYVDNVADCNDTMRQLDHARQVFLRDNVVISNLPVARDGYIDRCDFYAFVQQFYPGTHKGRAPGARVFGALVRAVRDTKSPLALDIQCRLCSTHVAECVGYPVGHGDSYRINLVSLKLNATEIGKLRFVNPLQYADIMRLVELA